VARREGAKDQNGATTPAPAAVYCRISRDPEGERAGVERQEADCRALAARLGYRVADLYVDNDAGASTRSRKARPQYAAMLAAARTGRYAAVLAYSNSRLTRRPREVEDLLELAERHGVAIRTCVSGDWDLTTADGRAVARTIAAWDGAEAERIAERVARARLAAAQAGRAQSSRRRFGYSPDGAELVTREANAIRDAYAAALAGASLLGIAKRWNAEGLTTTQGAGRGWTSTTVRSVLRNPRNAGLSVYHGEILGDAQSPAIVPVETWQAMRELLDDRRRPRTSAPKYLLTGVARCGICGATVTAGTNGDGRRRVYRCSTPHVHVTRKAAWLDDYVTALVLERLSRPDARDLLTDTTRPDVDALRADARAVRARLDAVAVEYADGTITGAQLRTATARLRSRLLDTESQLADAGRVDVLGPLLTGTDPAAAWDALDTDRRRAVVALLMDVTILRTRRGARSFDPAGVRIDWRTA